MHAIRLFLASSLIADTRLERPVNGLMTGAGTKNGVVHILRGAEARNILAFGKPHAIGDYAPSGTLFSATGH